MYQLTSKQQTILKALKDFFAGHNQMPTLRELKRFLSEKYEIDFKSLRSIHQYLQSLEKKGFIHRGHGAREIKLLDTRQRNFCSIPIFGWVNAGAPSFLPQEAVEGYLKIAKTLLPKKNNNLFAIKVVGDSMNLAKIKKKVVESGNYVIINRDDKNFQDKDIAVANIDGALTLKEFRIIDKNTLGLFPKSTNAEHKPIYLSKADDFLIIGKVFDVFKG